MLKSHMPESKVTLVAIQIVGAKIENGQWLGP